MTEATRAAAPGRRERLYAQLKAAASGTLRLPPARALEFADHLTDATDSLRGIGLLCAAPQAGSAEVLAAMLTRWFQSLQAYEMPRRALLDKPGPLADFAMLSESSLRELHARIVDACVGPRALSEFTAVKVATHVTQALSGFYALEQMLRAPDKHSQREICAMLRAALGEPLEQAKEAARVFRSPS